MPRYPPCTSLWWVCVPARLEGWRFILYYQALSLGEMGLTTALTGLLTALVPVVYSFFDQGSPKSSQLAGFVVAAGAIALIAYAPAGAPRPLALGLATLAGLGFGVFLVVLKVGSAHGLLWQLIYSRMASATLACAHGDWGPGAQCKDAAVGASRLATNAFLLIAGSAGVLEATGSLLYMRSATEGRLDVAAVLASLYPVGHDYAGGVVFEGTYDVESGIGNGTGVRRRRARFPVTQHGYLTSVVISAWVRGRPA